MARLRKILNTEKRSLQSNNANPESAGQGDCAPQARAMSSPTDATGDDYHPSEPALPRLSQMQNQTFLGIEKQFEELHDQFRTRPSRSLSSKSRRYKHIGAKPSLLRNKRHVDVLQAIFSPYKYRPIATTPVTPTTTYNEDIADRNLRVPVSIRVGSSPYAHVISSRYQEDVADRNIQINGCNLDTAHSSVARHNLRLRRRTGWGEGEIGDVHIAPRSKSEMATHSLSYEENSSALREISSDQDLRSEPDLVEQQWRQAEVGEYRPQGRRTKGLRSQCSAPALSPTSAHDHSELADQSRASPKRAAVPHSTHHPLSAKAANRLVSPNPMRSVSRKNVHDLSINTSLAAPRKTFVKVPHRPTESKAPTPRKEAPANIAEIVNSPISAATSTRPSPNYNVEEIMNLFKKAYVSSQSTSPHPTFESLQDAIIREINSHDAFRHINSDSSGPSAPPGLSPDLTSDDCHETQFLHPMNNSPSQRTVSRNKLQPKQVRNASMRRQRRNLDTLGRELSFPALKGEEHSPGDNISKTKFKKRRHTYGQPHSVGVVQNYDHESMADKGEIKNQRQTPNAPPGHNVIPPSKASSNPGLSTYGPRRSRSSHGLTAEAADTILDPTSRPPKRPHSLSLLRPTSRSKLATKQQSLNNVAKGGNQQQQPRQPFADHVAEGGEEQRAGKRTVSAASLSSERRHPSIRPVAHEGNKNRGRTPPVSTAGQKRIPLRKSSIQKDLYDSGRFRM